MAQEKQNGNYLCAGKGEDKPLLHREDCGVGKGPYPAPLEKSCLFVSLLLLTSKEGWINVDKRFP